MPQGDVNYYAHRLAGTLFVTHENDLVYNLPQKTAKRTPPSWAFRESLVGARASRPRGATPSATRVSYFKGPDPSQWRSKLETFDTVSLGEVSRTGGSTTSSTVFASATTTMVASW